MHSTTKITLAARYGAEIALEIDAWFRNFEEERDGRSYEYMDNYRAARISDPEEMKAYHKAYEHGCCGSYDETVLIQGEQFKLGFNYGH